MKEFAAIFTLFCFLLVETGNCQAQISDQASSKTTEQNNSVSKDSSADISIAEIELRMAESNYRIDQSQERLFELVVAYEKILGPVCMPKLLIDQDFKPDPENEKCHELIEKTLALYPHSPIAICARDGISSDSCTNAFTHQTFSLIDSDSSSQKPMIPDLDLQLEALRQEDDDKELKDDWNEAARAYGLDKTKENLIFAARKLISLINHNCKLTRISYKKRENDSKDHDLLGPLGIAKTEHLSETTENAEIFMRTIAATNRCKDTIEDALKFDPYFPTAVCIKNSLVSPACLDAHKRWTTKVKTSRGAKPGTAKPKRERGFETF